MWQALVKRLMGVVLRNPGIPEPLLVAQMDAVSPAAAEQMLGVLVAQQHLIVKEISVSSAAGGAAGAGSVGSAVSSAAEDERPALKLGLALSRCLSAAGPAKPPSLLLGRSRPAAAAGVGGEQGARAVVVRHYWPSLVSSSVCHLTALPPCRTAAGVAGGGAAAAAGV
jgi:hypothetical protein